MKVSNLLYHFEGVSCGGCAADICSFRACCNIAGSAGLEMTGTIKQADLFLITGALNGPAAERLKRLASQIVKPCMVVAYGACAVDGGILRESPEYEGSPDRFIKVDIYITGCPPSRGTLIEALKKGGRSSDE